MNKLTISFIDGTVSVITNFKFYNIQGSYLVVALDNGNVDCYNADKIISFTFTPEETI